MCGLTKKSGVTVINGGQGGDEAWGGYFGYLPAYLRTLAGQARRHLPSTVRSCARPRVALLARSETRKSALKALATGRRGRLQAMPESGKWAGEAFSGMAAMPPVEALVGAGGRTPLARAMYYDLKWYLPALLQVEDRTSMAFSLESRAPLLDYRLLELSAQYQAPSGSRAWK